MIRECVQMLRITTICIRHGFWLLFYPKQRVARSMIRDLARVNIIFLKILQVTASSFDDASDYTDYTTQVPFDTGDIQLGCIRRLQATFPIVIAPHPIYAGSSCLIYQAVYKDRRVIVKIKRTNLNEYIQTSVSIALVLCRLIDRLSLVPVLSLVDVCAEVTPNILDQTDFTNELYNMHLFQRRFNTTDSPIRIPETFDEFTAMDENVIVMEQVPGAHMQHLDATHAHRMCELVSHFNMQCIVERGMFHGDLHCGNVLYDRDADVLYVLDFGITGFMSRKEVGALVSIMKAYAWKNFQRMAYLVVAEMAELPADVPVGSLVDVCHAVQSFLSDLYQTRAIVTYEDITALYALVKSMHIRIGRTFHRLQMSLGITNAMCAAHLTPDENNRIMHESFRLVLPRVLSSKSHK